MKNKRGTIDQAINETLLTLGVPANLKGFDYIKEILFYIIESNIKTIKLKDGVYKVVADIYNISEDAIERDIRYSIEIGYLRTKNSVNEDVYKNSISYDKVKPTNKQFIKTVFNIVSNKIDSAS